jgi:CRISPR-associated endonuclease/helicase Cas3
MDYPLATRLDARGLGEERIVRRLEAARAVPVRLISDPEQVALRLAAAVEAGARVAWIRNTVDDAREAWQDLSGRLGPERVTLFHARFALCDRLAREEEVLRLFGKEREELGGGRLLIATQVIEQSLDLDMDLLATDLAPMDLILQRLGRLWRHEREGRPLPGPELLVLSPPPTDDAPANWYAALFPQAQWVYQHHGQLWLTARELARRGEIAVPGQARALMEAVYGEAAEEPPQALQPREDKQSGQDQADMSLAWMNCLSPTLAYGEALSFWEEDTPTRLGRRQSILRLARWEKGRLAPWAEGRVQTDDPARVWELSSVAVSRNRAAAEAPIADPALKRAVEETKAAWPDRVAERVLLVPLTPGPEGEWDGLVRDKDEHIAELRYHSERGLSLAKKP